MPDLLNIDCPLHNPVIPNEVEGPCVGGPIRQSSVFSRQQCQSLLEPTATSRDVQAEP